jgi:hypothetical protein
MIILDLTLKLVTYPLQPLAPLGSVLRALREELSLQRTRNRFKSPSAHKLTVMGRSYTLS